jgi:hypothetical protein
MYIAKKLLLFLLCTLTFIVFYIDGWYYLDAVRENGKLYHSACLSADETAAAAAAASPVKRKTEDPLDGVEPKKQRI